MRFGTYDAVPDWARFFSLDELRAFLGAVEGELRRRRLLFEDRRGLVIVATPDGRVVQCGLANVALRCAAAGRAGFEGVIREHFERLFGDVVIPDEPPPSFEEVRPYVKVRIYEDAHIAGKEDEVVSRRLSVDLNAVIVYDFPHLAVAMPRAELARYEILEEDVFRIGKANLAKTKVERESLPFPGGASGFCLVGEEGYGSAHVLHLERFFDRPPLLGALVSFPARNALLCSPIRPSTVVSALRELILLTNSMYDGCVADERSPLSPDIHWWKAGRLTHIPSGIDILGLRGCVIVPPPELLEVVLRKTGTGFTGDPTVLN